MEGVQQSPSRISKQALIKTALVLYIVLSAGYILLSQAQAYQLRLAQSAYLEGRTATIEQLIEQAESGCDPFPVYTEEKQVQLINVDCLMQVSAPESNEAVPAAPGGE